MAKCPNCGASLSCGCQRKTVNGVTGCNNCLKSAPAKTISKKSIANPQTANVWGKDRYNNLNKFVK